LMLAIDTCWSYELIIVRIKPNCGEAG